MIFLKNFYLFIYIIGVTIIWKFSRILYDNRNFLAKEFLLRCKNDDTFSSIIKEISQTLLPNEISMCLNFHNDGFAYFP